MNYYHLDSSLSGHTDHSEKDLTQPLLSLRCEYPTVKPLLSRRRGIRGCPYLRFVRISDKYIGCNRPHALYTAHNFC